MVNIDLHIHSAYSLDGEATVEEIVNMCLENGVKTFSITDHNCVAAIPLAIKVAHGAGLKCIPGIEIDCIHEGINMHLLAYGFDYTSEDFVQIEEEYLLMEKELSRVRIEKINELGFALEYDVMGQNNEEGIIIPEEIAKALLQDDRYNEVALLKCYRQGGSRSDNPYVNFYWDYFSQGKSCYIEEKLPSVEEIIKTVKNNMGTTVIAHPGANFANHPDQLQRLIDIGVDGIEVYSTYHTKEQTAYYSELAKENKILSTIGSDYHGENKPSIIIGGLEIEDYDRDVVSRLNL